MTVDPSPEQLRDVAILAEVMLRIQAAQTYGLVDGGPEVDGERCREIIDRARAAGHVWTPAEIDQALIVALRELA